MNEILQLKGTFEQSPNTGGGGGRNIPKNANAITSDKLQGLLKDLKGLSSYWSGQKVVSGCLIDAYYIDVIAKSNRAQGLLCVADGGASDFIVGAKFVGDTQKKHVITYYVSHEVLNFTLDKIQRCINLLEVLGGSIGYEDIEGLRKKKLDFKRYGLTKTSFCHVIVDAHYLEGFRLPNNSANAASESIITVYKTGVGLVDLMKEVGVTVLPGNILSETTLFLFPDQIAQLAKNAPYLIAMATEDLSKLSHEDFAVNPKENFVVSIDPPDGEPTIGVIDTMFDESAYFSEWVDFRKMISEDIELELKDYAHGTAVSSIIVDGPTMNPELDDGCGRFRVRHFGVATQGPYSSFFVMKTIREIVDQNPDIKVWNLSLGSDKEVNPNFISPEAAILDQIQCEKDIIFIIAGTNKKKDGPPKVIGSPADSINAIVVNSVNRAGNPASYTREGRVLSFFNKPDVSSYGGDDGEEITVCTPFEDHRSGTSFAAPWVTRKVAYLIEVLGLSREIAKALIVDAAAGWTNIGNDHARAPLMGHGVVPIRIEDVVKTSNDEIKFVITDVSEKWNTFNYNLPVPISNAKHPFFAKATLCYFPSCSINQGVDYTNTELDFYFGRVKDDEIKSINRNAQNINDGQRHYIYEGSARQVYRKWDNTKHITDTYSERSRPREVYGSGMWGISIKTTERLGRHNGEGIKFGLVVTLKEMTGANRINEFMRMCAFRGWLVNRIDVDNRIDIYNKAQENLTLDV
jgi:hypothetical protein